MKRTRTQTELTELIPISGEARLRPARSSGVEQPPNTCNCLGRQPAHQIKISFESDFVRTDGTRLPNVLPQIGKDEGAAGPRQFSGSDADFAAILFSGTQRGLS